MNEEQNKDSPPSSEGSQQPEVLLNHPSSDELIVPAEETAEAEQLLTTNYKPETENMEVHHHAHDPAAPHHKKNWKSYFWEFLMLFLAVFCGFLAEYQLEHKIERDRAKELAKSFYEELKNDSVNVQVKYQNREKCENALLYLRRYFLDSNMASLSKTFVVNFNYGVMFRTPTLFEARTVVLEQLKNSGSLRYFKNNKLQELIGDLSVVINNINDRQALETAVRAEYINPLIVKHFDYDFQMKFDQFEGKNTFEKMLVYEQSDSIIPFGFKKMELFDPQGASNAFAFYSLNALRGTRTVHLQKYIELNAALLQLLRKEYHLE